MRAKGTEQGSDLRVCASCEWIFKLSEHPESACPKCGFGHYSAYRVYGAAAYRYEKSQKRWKEKKMADYDFELDTEIEENRKKIRARKTKKTGGLSLLCLLNGGFTLTEFLILLAILGILIALAGRVANGDISQGLCVYGYRHSLDANGNYRQIIDNQGHGIPCGGNLQGANNAGTSH